MALTAEQIETAIDAPPSEHVGGWQRPVDRDYPYEPGLDVELLEGLEKLRAVEDRYLAQMLYELYPIAEANERNPVLQKRQERAARAREVAEIDRLQAIGDNAFEGKLGKKAKKLANFMLIDDSQRDKPRRTDLRSLEEFEKELRKMRRRGVE